LTTIITHPICGKRNKGGLMPGERKLFSLYLWNSNYQKIKALAEKSHVSKALIINHAVKDYFAGRPDIVLDLLPSSTKKK